MAQTRKRRRTKHRGNAAGMVEARGRTGRKPTADEIKATAADERRRKREARLDQPPTWRSAFNRAAIAAGLFVVAVIVVLRQHPAAAVSLGALMLVLYVPLSYYTDLVIYRRRQRKKAEGGRR